MFRYLNASTGAEEALKKLTNLKASDFTNFSSAKNYLHRQFWNPNKCIDVQFLAPIIHHSLLLQSTMCSEAYCRDPEVLVQPWPCTPLKGLCPEHPLCLRDTALTCTDTSRKTLLKSRCGWTFLTKKLTRSTCRKLRFNRMSQEGANFFSEKILRKKKTNVIKC